MLLNKLLDIYYKRPMLYDFLLSAIAVALLLLLESKGYIQLAFDVSSQVIPSIGITASGFILTILTILLTIKSNSIVTQERVQNNSFRIFLASDLYSKAISVLKNGVASLLFISFLTISISVFFPKLYKDIGVYLNLVCIILICLVFVRSFYILNLIFKMQNKNFKD